MPNNIRNELSFIGTEDNVREVLEFISSKDGKMAIDFNRIVPRPATIGIERSSRVADGIKLAKKLKLDTMDREMIDSIVAQFGTDVAKNIRLGRIALYNLEKYGNVISWYSSLMDAEETLKIKGASTPICRCCKGKIKQAYGFKWKYDKN